MMRVAHVTYSSSGGAGMAAARISDSLAKYGITSELLSVSRNSVSSSPLSNPILASQAAIEALAMSRRPSQLFTPLRMWHTNPGLLRRLEIGGYDVVNLHWTIGALSPSGLRRLATTAATLVWTLHDYRPFTGGCHYPGSCTGMAHACEACPLTHRPTQRLVAGLARVAKEEIRRLGIHFVFPSEGLAEQMQPVLETWDLKFSVIPNPVSKFSRVPLTSNRAGLMDKRYFVFVAENLSDPRKGLQELIHWWENTALDDLYDLILIGGNGSKFEDVSRRIFSLGSVSQAEVQAWMSHSQGLLFGSHADNAPGVVLEAMLSEVPVFCMSSSMEDWLRRDGVPVYSLTVLEKRSDRLPLFDADTARTFLAKRSEIAVAKSYSDLYLSLQNKPVDSLLISPEDSSGQ